MSQFGDTTYTKVFVGGLAWETQRETLGEFFEHFGEILEAAVITDKSTGRSKGYGFVTFREAEAAARACADPSPVIDGRRANCNLASLGLQRSRPTTPKHGGRRDFRVMKSFHGGTGTAFASAATLPHYSVQQGFPYNVYGYPPYSMDYAYPTSYYNVYGGAATQYPTYGGATGTAAGSTSFYYPCYQFDQAGGGAASHGAYGQGYSMQYTQMFQCSPTAAAGSAAQHYFGGPMHLSPSPPTQAGMTMALTSPTPPTPSTHHYSLIPAHFTAPIAREQPLA